MSRLLIVGAGGHGRVVADTAELSGHWSSIVFFDDNFPMLLKSSDWPVVGKVADIDSQLQRDDSLFIAVGNAKIRQSLFERFDSIVRLPNVIHPRALVSSRATFGRGCIVCAGAVINIGATLGNGVIVNSSASVDHDCSVGDFAHICPGAHLAGTVNVGLRSWIGVGASVKQGVIIGCDVMIGAGAAVVTNISDALTVAGVPAKMLRQ